MATFDTIIQPVTAEGNVEGQASIMLAMGDLALADGLAFLDKIAGYVPAVINIEADTQFESVTTPSADFNKPVVPIAPTIDFNLPDIPGGYQPGNVDTSPLDNTGNPPDFTVTPPTINIDGIPLPDELDADAPGDAPNLDLTYVSPTLPDTTLPSTPTLIDLDLPDPVELDYPTFDLTLPDDSGLIVPGLTFNFTEATYNSDLLDAVALELQDRVENGGTGLPVAVENQIWDRARNREDQNASRTSDEILSKGASRGFQRPPGSVVSALDAAAQEAQHKIADLSREIAIKQAELEQTNIRHAIEQAISLENILITHHNNTMNRALEAAKFIQQVGITIFDSAVKKFDAQVALYKADADVFKIRVEAEISKIEAYKAEIEAEAVKNEINETLVKVYLGQIEGIKNAVEVYKAQWDGVKAKLAAETTRISAFKTEVEAYATQVSAKSSEYENYATRVKAQQSKAEVFDSQVKAFAAQIQAYASEVDAASKKVEADVDVEKVKIQQYLAQIEYAVKGGQLEQLAFAAAVDEFRALAAMYTAEVQAEGARVDAETKVFQLELEEAIQKANIALKNAEINITNANNASSLLLESYKAGGTIASSLTSASLSALNVSMGISETASFSEQHSFEEQ